jgi:hypothetical protein
MRIKKQLSPVWWLRSGYPGYRNIHFYHSYQSGQNGYGNNLSAADWEPGVVKNDFAGLKAFSEPHDGYPRAGLPWPAQDHLQPGNRADDEWPDRVGPLGQRHLPRVHPLRARSMMYGSS